MLGGTGARAWILIAFAKGGDCRGARDLTPGPHAESPACPPVSWRLRKCPPVLKTRVASCPFVSARFLSVPRMRDTDVTRREVKGTR